MCKENQIREAIRRMEDLQKKFNLNESLVSYLKNNEVYYSYLVLGMFGCIDTINYDERYSKITKEFEERTGSYVYHAIETYSQYGRLLTLLFVSADEDEWTVERLTSNYLMAYIYNMDESLGEYGDVFLTSDNGALLRIA